LTQIDTVLLKVASRCNLDCTYCYVFNMGDDGWRRQPKRFSAEIESAVISQLVELHQQQRRPFSIVLHGGEPLLLGTEGLQRLLGRLRRAVPLCGIHIQTNGTLLNSTMLDLLAEHRVGISISLDGPEHVTDAFRLDLRGRGSFARVKSAVERLKAHPAGRELFSGLLAVVDPRSNPVEVYEFFKGTGAPSVDFLYRDGNHSRLPFGKASTHSVEYGRWMCALLDLYLADTAPPKIRVLDDMLKLAVGGTARKEGVGISDYGIVVIDTDGSINKNDTLKSTSNGADLFASRWSVMTHRLTEVVGSDEFTAYHEAQRPSSEVCKSCPELGVCGGGMPVHRWSDVSGLNNPTVFCADQQLLIGRMREWLKYHVQQAA
jgi:uncharacterized protein